MPGKPNAGKVAAPAPAAPTLLVTAAVLVMETPAAVSQEDAELGEEVVVAPGEAMAVPAKATEAAQAKRKAQLAQEEAAAPAKHAGTSDARAKTSAAEPSSAQRSSEPVVPNKRPRLVLQGGGVVGACPRLPEDESFVDGTNTVLDLIHWARYFACDAMSMQACLCVSEGFLWYLACATFQHIIDKYQVKVALSHMLHSDPRFTQFLHQGSRPDGPHHRPGPAELHTYPPLSITGRNGQLDDLVAYQAPWDPAVCEESLARSRIYQAGANIVWIKAVATSSPIPVSTSAPWCQISGLADTFFRREGNRATVQQDGRIVFPSILEAFTDHPLSTGVAAPAQRPGPAPPPPTLQDGELLLLGGHALVQAWWVGMARALAAGHHLDVAALWQCGLSVTVLLRDEPSRCRLVSLAIRFSETLRVQERALTDNFITFADKLAALGLPLQTKSLSQFRDHWGSTCREVQGAQLAKRSDSWWEGIA